MRDEDKLYRYDAEDIVRLTANTYENNLLKFVVLFGEDDYFLGGMRNGDESDQKTLNEIIVRTNNYGKLARYFRLQENSSYFYGIIKIKRIACNMFIDFSVHRPGSGDITPEEHASWVRFVDENESIINNENCKISLDGNEEDFDSLKDELSCSISAKRKPVITFSGSKLPIHK